MLKVAIIGCGKIADAHASTISMIPNADVVAACDREELMARQLCERYNIKRYFSNLDSMLEAVRPDVVHITTPPDSHFELGRICLDAGCHVYIEKPITVTSDQAEQLICLANEKKLRLTVGTDEQFSHIAIAMRELIREGYLGGPPVHMESYYCYDLGDERYARAFLNNDTHWLRKLPGQLMHNVISHGIARIAEFLAGDFVEVTAHGFTSEFLRRLGENDLKDELRVLIRDVSHTTAYFTFSTQMRPLLREFRIYGPKNGLILNQSHHSLIKLSGGNYASYLEKVIPLNSYARQYRKNIIVNTGLFFKRDFHMKSGLRRLIQLFYASITEGSPLPIPYREVLLTSRIMDSIFAQTCTLPSII